jgi:hypothetical protein
MKNWMGTLLGAAGIMLIVPRDPIIALGVFLHVLGAALFFEERREYREGS